jgi:hypothetical protein
VSASWVIRDRVTKVAVLETFDKRIAQAINLQRYEALPIEQYLGELNATIKLDK